jgi:hypothetical protein
VPVLGLRAVEDVTSLERNAADRQIAEVRAREVTGVFEVQNSLSVAGTEK